MFYVKRKEQFFFCSNCVKVSKKGGILRHNNRHSVTISRFDFNNYFLIFSRSVSRLLVDTVGFYYTRNIGILVVLNPRFSSGIELGTSV